MATKAKAVKAVKAVKVANPVVQAQPAPVANPAALVVTQVASTATKLTKRNNTALAATLVATGKPVKLRVQHTQLAWAAVQAALPATATALCALPALAHPACVSPQGFVSYMLRRGYLTVQA